MFEKDLLKGKVVLITGGGTGLGRAMGERYLELGANLAICGRREEVLKTAATEMVAAKGGEVFTIPCDVRDPEQVENMVAAAWEHYGGVDILVNNAAGNFTSPTELLSHRAVDAVLGIVAHGTFYVTLALGKKWIATKHKGRVLSIVATYTDSGSAFVVPSAAGKAAVLAMSKSLAVEWARYGITMVCIAPGPFPTPGAWERLMPDPALHASAINRIPLKRVGRYEELANLASYLVSDQAEYINGECIRIDGGEFIKGAGEFSWMEQLTTEQWVALAEKGKKVGK
ncbi:MAG: SDR family oxidoreductase [Gemmatimonadetes bacterium]|nr:SDR family oxidoreductase [Gemmatimonadota bacterium]